MIFSIISYSLGSRLRNQLSSTYIESNSVDKVKSLQSMKSNAMAPIGDSNIVDSNIHFFDQNFNAFDKADATQILNSVESNNLYEYIFSLKSIGLFSLSSATPLNASGTKSFFVSKKINTNGRPIKVKMLADYFSELKSQNSAIRSDKTSIEFSVSIVDNPSNEADWIPIIPYADEGIRTEKLFPNQNGECNLRFTPSATSIYLYENGEQKINGITIVNGNNIKINTFNINKQYFVSYIPANADVHKEVGLHSRSLATPVLISPSYNGSNGERFTSTTYGNRVRLSQDPYIDYSKFVNASYNAIRGTITSSSTSASNYDYSLYSPVKVVLDDGTQAINITNYLIENFQIESFYTTDSLLFIHSGDSVIFNRSINQGFRVLYQYIPDSFRYRVIMRSLTQDPQNYSVDRLIFKFSTEKRDSLLINLIKYDNLFKNKVN